MFSRFQAYDPYNSFISKDQCFLDRAGETSGWSRVRDSDDALQLWRLGRDAFQALPDFQSPEVFDEAFKGHQEGINILRQVLQENGGHLDYRNADGVSWVPDFSTASSTEILGVFWQVGGKQKDQAFQLSYHFLFSCLEEIDYALMGMALDNDHLHAVIAAVHAFSNYQAIVTGNNDLQKVRSELAFLAAKERHANDPKQSDKSFVFGCWKDWCQRPEKYKSKAAFARDMLDKCEKLESQKVIEDWCRQWEREHK